jgi:prepilin-type N-terminal cleavage/methylation domain-containing protein
MLHRHVGIMTNMLPDRSTRVRAVTLLEVMVVLAIAGLLASMAAPSFQDMAVHYRSQEGARGVLMAMTRARALAQRENVPTRLVITPTQAVVQIATFGALTAEQIASTTRRTVVAFADHTTLALPPDATVTSLQTLAGDGTVASTVAAGVAGASIIFCASSDSYYRDADTGQPVCGVGDLTSASARIQFAVLGQPFHIKVNAALGSVDLRRGTL